MEITALVKDFGLLGVVIWVLYVTINSILPQLRKLSEDHSQQQIEHEKQNIALDRIVANANRLNGNTPNNP